MFTGTLLTDTVTAFKLFPRADIASLPLRPAASSWTTKSRRSWSRAANGSSEVPISYFPRSKEEGKKIGPRDWFIGTRTFWRYRNGAECRGLA